MKTVREWGVTPGFLSPGAKNAITDVAGVRVGHCTLVQGDSVRTGVTAILPHGDNLFTHRVPAAVTVINGFGKAAGLSQIQELGELETPVILTNTLAVGTALDALVQYKLARNPEIGRKLSTVNGVVLECNDGYLNDIRARAVRFEHVHQAIDAAASGPVSQGNVGAGTGMSCFEYKGGIGTSSRIAGDWCCGVLVLANFGRRHQLQILGAPVGQLLPRPQDSSEEKGSIVMIVATDAPLDARQLGRVSKRTAFGLARTGSVAGNGSGDFALAFSTGVRYQGVEAPIYRLPDKELDPLFEAVAQATEEAILNALFCAQDMTGRDGNYREALPVTEIINILPKWNLRRNEF